MKKQKQVIATVTIANRPTGFVAIHEGTEYVCKVWIEEKQISGKPRPILPWKLEDYEKRAEELGIKKWEHPRELFPECFVPKNPDDFIYIKWLIVPTELQEKIGHRYHRLNDVPVGTDYVWQITK